MPEQHRPRRGVQPYMLGEAVDNGSLVKARCGGCSPVRWYHPKDLITLYGNIPARNLARQMRCGRCKALLTVDVTTPTAEERQNLRLRRLDGVWWARRVRWREE